MNEAIQFDPEKFKDVVHFIISEVEGTHGQSALGNVKLHKILYYSDFLSYLSTMRPLTGADYQRQKFGPTARFLSSATRQLMGEGRIEVQDVDYFGYAKKNYLTATMPRTNRLTDEERSLIREVVNFVCGKSASEISEFSHDEVWSSVQMGDRIPYFAAYALFPAELTDEDMSEAADEAVRIAPLIMAEFGDARRAV